MKVDVRYFASIREALGSGETLEVAQGATVALSLIHISEPTRPY